MSWSSTFDMMRRYQEVRDVLTEQNSEDFDDVLIIPGEDRCVEDLC